MVNNIFECTLAQNKKRDLIKGVKIKFLTPNFNARRTSNEVKVL